VEASGQLARANEDLYANAFVASGITPDGGTAAYAFMSNRDAKWKLGPGTSMELRPAGNTLHMDISDVRIPTLYVTQPACTPATDCFWFSDGWFGTFPGSTPACTAGKEGGLKGNSTSHELIYCDGTANNTVAFTAKWSGALNFAVFGGVGCQALSFNALGAVRDENVAPGGCGSVDDADTNLQCTVSATDTDEVTVKVCCLAGGGCVDLNSITFSAAALR
jgi:hypothetical protein